MIQINFLAEEKRQLDNNLSYFLWASVLLSMLILGLQGCQYNGLVKQQQALSLQQSNSQKMNTQQQQQIKKAKLLQKTLNEYLAKQNTIQQLRLGQSAVLDLLEGLSFSLPKNIWLRHFSMNNN
jgi:Tfp pilus assembly protein PilN